MKTQKEQILDHLRTYHRITSMQAFRLFGCTRLSARIGELRADGYPIETEYETKKGKTYGVYRYVA